MTFVPEMPESGVLVHVHGPTAHVSEHFESIEALRRWTPPFEVTRVEIFDTRPPIQAKESFTIRPDGTHVSDLEGILVICTAVRDPNPIGSALAAYEWAYGDNGDTVRLPILKR